MKGRLTIDLKRAGIGDSPLAKSSFRWKKGGRTSPQSTLSTAVSDVLRNENYNPFIKQHKHC